MKTRTELYDALWDIVNKIEDFTQKDDLDNHTKEELGELVKVVHQMAFDTIASIWKDI